MRRKESTQKKKKEQQWNTTQNSYQHGRINVSCGLLHLGYVAAEERILDQLKHCLTHGYRGKWWISS